MYEKLQRKHVIIAFVSWLLVAGLCVIWGLEAGKESRKFQEQIKQQKILDDEKIKRWEKEHPVEAEEYKQEKANKYQKELNRKYDSLRYETDYETRKKYDPNTTKKVDEYTPGEYWDLKTKGLKVDKNGNPVK